MEPQISDTKTAADKGQSITPPTRPPSLAAARDQVLLSSAKKALRNLEHGQLRITMPSGVSAVIGGPAETEAALELHSLNVIWRAMRRGTLGFAESYIDGSVRTENLGEVFRFFLRNFDNLDSAGKGWFKARLPDRLAHRMRANTRQGSRRNIAEHYDLGNAFYAEWLDPGMAYSSALFQNADLDLEAAQAAKNAAVLKALDIKPGHKVLEIGCGWGGLAELMVEAGAHVTGLTLSKQQLAYARKRLGTNAGSNPGQMSGQRPERGTAEIRFQDYRDVQGKFDRIVSVEMIEAVGESHWPAYFEKISKSLKPDGRAVLQAITISEDCFETYRRHPDFIQRYIFPGGMLPTIEIMQDQARRQNMEFHEEIRFGRDYAETLRIWKDRFNAAWPRIEKLGFDERFQRMWNYYLTYCEIGFDDGIIDVGIYTMDKR